MSGCRAFLKLIATQKGQNDKPSQNPVTCTYLSLCNVIISWCVNSVNSSRESLINFHNPRDIRKILLIGSMQASENIKHAVFCKGTVYIFLDIV